MSANIIGKSEVPSKMRNLDEALAKSDMHLLGVGDSPEVSVSERRVGGKELILCVYFFDNIVNHIL